MAEAAKEDEEPQAAEAEEVAAANRVWLRQGTLNAAQPGSCCRKELSFCNTGGVAHQVSADGDGGGVPSSSNITLQLQLQRQRGLQQRMEFGNATGIVVIFGGGCKVSHSLSAVSHAQS